MASTAGLRKATIVLFWLASAAALLVGLAGCVAGSAVGQGRARCGGDVQAATREGEGGIGRRGVSDWDEERSACRH